MDNVSNSNQKGLTHVSLYLTAELIKSHKAIYLTEICSTYQKSLRHCSSATPAGRFSSSLNPDEKEEKTELLWTKMLKIMKTFFSYLPSILMVGVAVALLVWHGKEDEEEEGWYM